MPKLCVRCGANKPEFPFTDSSDSKLVICGECYKLGLYNEREIWKLQRLERIRAAMLRGDSSVYKALDDLGYHLAYSPDPFGDLKLVKNEE